MSNQRIAALLRVSLAFVWIHTGVACLLFVPIEESAALAARVGLGDALARWTVWGTSVFEIVLGLAVLARFRPRAVAALQIVLIAGFTVLISAFLPEFWRHPFGPVSKNVVLIAAAWAAGQLSGADSEFAAAANSSGGVA